MRSNQILALLIITTLIATPKAFALTPSTRFEITGFSDLIIDGDTFDITAENGTKYRIRLADVNANELGQEGYEEATQYLKTSISGKNVYLDIDNLYLWDNHGAGSRLVCIPFVEYNSTHFMNVCEALYLAGHVEKRDYANEFNPTSWSLYVPKEQSIPEFAFKSSLIFLLIAVSTMAYSWLRMRKPIRAPPV